LCAGEKGKPVVRQGRKASMGLLELVLGGGQVAEQQGGVTKLRHKRGEGV